MGNGGCFVLENERCIFCLVLRTYLLYSTIISLFQGERHMDRPSFRRRMALLLIPILLFSAFPLPALAETISPAEEALSSTEAAQLPTQASEPPTEATEAPAGMAESHPTETAPSTEATQAPPGETTVPTEATAPPTEEATGATEATAPPTEETTAAAEATEPPAGLSAVPTVPMESRRNP